MSAAHAHPHAWRVHISLDRSSGVATLIVHGRIGHAGAAELHTALQNAVVAGVEAAFDDGWPVHPADDHGSLTTKRPRSVYAGGAGVVDALHRA